MFRDMEQSVRLRVRELREARGWSQAELARRAGVRVATVNRIELERTNAIDFRVLDVLAHALEVDPGYLITRTRPATPAPREKARKGKAK